MAVKDYLVALERNIGNARQGLATEVFLFVSRLTPMVNVELLIKNEKNKTLLTWREDEYYGPGWHLPGGVVRFKETVATRIQAVAESELGARVEFQNDPLVMNEIMNPTRDTRGHFISFLYECKLTSSLDPSLEYRKEFVKNGQWAWHGECPENLIAVHEIYRNYICTPA
tara:strand:+ start:40492 stop:41001 length:510 start_codon:yes stop_codon:yes gene_type:complete